MTLTLELFDCRPYRARMTREACARRYKAANTNSKPVRGQKASGDGRDRLLTKRLEMGFCIGCPVGKRHLEEVGYHPIGGPGGTSKARKCALCGMTGHNRNTCKNPKILEE